MADVSKPRLALDLDDIERQLRHSSRQPGAAKSDPLAELARIVGQDDPFRALLAADRAALNGNADDIFVSASPSDASPQRQDAAGAGLRGTFSDNLADYDDDRAALTAEDEAILYGQRAPRYAPDLSDPAFYDEDGIGYADADSVFVAPEPRRSRKGVIAVGAVFAAAVIAIGSVVVLRHGGPSLGPDGQPPVVKADAGPAKVVPQNPGGIDIPNQNAQIYDRGAQDAQTRVVNREEQPLDVRQAARSAAASPAPALQGLNSATASILGEPRRVRTVSIRPDDGAVIGASPDGAAPPAASPALPAPSADVSAPSTMTSLGPNAPLAYSHASSPQRRAEAPAAPSARSNPASGPAPLQIAPEAPRARPEARIAAAPQASLREPAETSAAPANPGFTVQLGYRSTEREARSLFEQMTQRFPNDLSGFSPLVLEAEINGKTGYRVRVGPMSREEATSLCSRLKSSGGQCFVANN
jgi:hypothetical protein